MTSFGLAAAALRHRMPSGDFGDRRTPVRRWSARAALVALAGQLLSACVVPEHMHVSEGVAPQGSDINVRFRTTYYFRVFDYCWSADAGQDHSYRKIVPESDTLYRYRMTGQASALGNQIKFESGTLQKEQIDPFGADVVYNKDVGGYLYRSPEDAKREANLALQRATADAASNRALEDFQHLTGMLKTASKDTPPNQDQIGAIKKAMQAALERYLATLPPAPDPETTKAVAALTTRLDDLTTRLTTIEAKAPPPSADVTQVRKDLTAEIDKLTTDVAALKTKAVVATLDQFCSIGEIQRRGFQIMGPEGMRPFDQDARLIMAMHSSAKPLIETLSEYSGRLLTPQVNPAEQLLPLARETTRIVMTEQAVDRLALKFAESGDSKPSVAEIFDAATTAFKPEPK
jgi:hypothetical protein